MDNSQTELRKVLVKIMDYISENDLRKIKFIFSNEIRRQGIDDTSIKGAIDFFQQLLDQHTIDNENLSDLIDTFNFVGCLKAAQLLKNYQFQTSQIISTSSNVSENATFLKELYADVDLDKQSMHTIPYQEQLSNRQQQPLLNNNHNNEELMSFEARQSSNKISTLKLPINDETSIKTIIKKDLKYFIFLIYTIILILLLCCIIIPKFQHKKPLLIDNKNIYNRTQLCQPTPYLSSLDDLTVIKYGNVFGDNGGYSTDDSKKIGLTVSHYISSIFIISSDWINSMEFIYSSSDPLNKETSKSGVVRGSVRIYTNNHRKEMFNVTEKNSNERINRVHIYINIGKDYPKVSTRYIVGIQFHTTYNRSSPFYGSQQGQFFMEENQGFVLGYVRGGAYMYIERLQFIWYKV